MICFVGPLQCRDAPTDNSNTIQSLVLEDISLHKQLAFHILMDRLRRTDIFAKVAVFLLLVARSTSFVLKLPASSYNILALSERPAVTALTMTSSGKVSAAGNGRLLVSIMDQIGSGNDAISLVLASQSPRRREILDMMGLKERYTARPSPLDETKMQQELLQQQLSPVEYTRRLAEAKASALANAEQQSRTLYLGSDTIVEVDGTILEKPKDKAEAMTMLLQLSGREHFVHTGVALFHCPDKSEIDKNAVLVASFTETARVTFAKLTNEDVVAYVETGEPMDKAGSYGIQGIGGQLVSGLEGDFFTVMGLPMNRLSQALVEAVRQIAN